MKGDSGDRPSSQNHILRLKVDAKMQSRQVSDLGLWISQYEKLLVTNGSSGDVISWRKSGQEWHKSVGPYLVGLEFVCCCVLKKQGKPIANLKVDSYTNVNSYANVICGKCLPCETSTNKVIKVVTFCMIGLEEANLPSKEICWFSYRAGLLKISELFTWFLIKRVDPSQDSLKSYFLMIGLYII